MLTPEFLAASMIALGIGARHESAVRARETGGAARAAGEAVVRSRRGRRLRKRGFTPAGWDRR
jgi:hypothetical protein